MASENGKKPINWVKRLLTIRRTRGWSQAKLATELGVDQGTVSRWERAVSVPQTRLVRRAIRALRTEQQEERE